MKRMRVYLYYIILMLICPVFLGVGSANAGVNDFYFKDFTGDYYLSKDTEGVSHLKVVEKVTVVFPDYDQNKGICRQIAYTNQNGANTTLPSLTRSNLKLTRNGESEPIYSIEKNNGYYDVCTGNDNYVRGEQVYTFEYEFVKVVTEFEGFQELYWDTNGTGAQQRFDKVTARVHFAEPEVWSGESWCYVGKYGANGVGRCTITKISDGVEFTATNLTAHENLTYDVELKEGSFTVPEPEVNYIYVWLTALLGAVCALAIIVAVRYYLNTREKQQYYKGIFVKPEYQPSKKCGLPEMAEIYIGKKKDAKVAMLLEMVVGKKIAFIKGAKKRQWLIEVKNLSGVEDEYKDLLAILNGGTQPEVGDKIELKSRSATSKLIALKKAMEKKLLDDLKRDKLVEDNYRIGWSEKRTVWNIIVMTVMIAPVMMMVGVMLLKMMDEQFGLMAVTGQEMVFGREFWIAAPVMITVTTAIAVTFTEIARMYARHTMRGLEMSRYMDGLRLYIEMAEAERMKMLQSVKGADTSAEGIVKLYEKLLPYAAVFGLEESWLNEMKEYCKVKEIEEPDYLMHGIAAAEIARTMRRASDIARTSTVMASSGGASSSGFSGGGGGGFSGGGGGGGGFSGR